MVTESSVIKRCPCGPAQICGTISKSLLVSLALVLLLAAAAAAPVDEGTARAAADSWLTARNSKGLAAPAFKAPPPAASIVRDGTTLAYIYQGGNDGFILVAGDDMLSPILAHSEGNPFDPEVPAVAALLTCLEQRLEALAAEGASSSPEWAALFTGSASAPLDGAALGPLLTSTWHQQDPYNRQCPIDIDDGRRCIVGCVATAMSQVLRFHNHPARGNGSHSYEWDGQTLSADFETDYDWANMPNYLASYSTQEEIDAVAQLCYHCGVSVDMNYGRGASSAYAIDILPAFVRYFLYDPAIRYIRRSSYTDVEWFDCMEVEIGASRPVVYTMTNDLWQGHAIVLDGTDDTAGMYVHLNMGWGGTSDGWYSITDFPGTWEYGHIGFIGTEPGDVEVQLEVVSFADPNLEAAVRDALDKPSGDLYRADVNSLVFLQASNRGITDLSGIENCVHLTDLRLSDNDITDFAPLTQLPRLETLHLIGMGLIDIGFLATLTTLQELQLQQNQISDLSPLEDLTHLYDLYLRDNQISDLSPLVGLGIGYLDLRDNQVSDLSPLASLANLYYLVLDYNQVSDLSPLEDLTSLRRLNSRNNQIVDLSPLSDLFALEILDLRNNQIADVSPLAGLSNLRYSLRLENNQIHDLGPLADLVALEMLGLSSNQISNLSPLAGLTNLRMLSLGNNQIVDLSPLAGLTNLLLLYLNNNQITDLSPLAGLTALTTLELDYNQITDIGPLAGLTSLIILYLSNNQTSDISPLAGLMALEWLHLDNNQIGDTGSLAGLPAIERLDLKNNQISDIGSLAGLTALHSLYLDRNQISDLQPLVDNAGLTDGDTVDARVNPLSTSAYDVHIPALLARGVIVYYDPRPTPTPTPSPTPTPTASPTPTPTPTPSPIPTPTPSPTASPTPTPTPSPTPAPTPSPTPSPTPTPTPTPTPQPSALEVRNAVSQAVAVFDSAGNLFLDGALTQGGVPAGTSASDFLVKNASGSVVAAIDSSGNMVLAGSLHENQSSLDPPPGSFVIKNDAGDIVAYISAAGDLYLVGRAFLGS